MLSGITVAWSTATRVSTARHEGPGNQYSSPNRVVLPQKMWLSGPSHRRPKAPFLAVREKSCHEPFPFLRSRHWAMQSVNENVKQEVHALVIAGRRRS
eukprot:222606-Rhodomonas_salina.3